MGVLLGLTLRQMTGRRRLILRACLAALPVGLAALLATLIGPESQGFERNFIQSILNGMILGAILPIVVMALATAAFGNELEDRTLNVIVLKPIPRWSIVLPKLLGSIIVAVPLLLAAGVAAAAIGLDGAGALGLLAVAVALFAGIVAYASVFTWAGLVTTRALGFALVYVFLWEGLVTTFLSGVRYLSIRGYTLGILRGLDPDTYGSLTGTIEFPAAVAGVVLVTSVFFFLTVLRLQRMDVP
jgi:ABC-2 type transport system permease protein